GKEALVERPSRSRIGRVLNQPDLGKSITYCRRCLIGRGIVNNDHAVWPVGSIRIFADRLQTLEDEVARVEGHNDNSEVKAVHPTSSRCFEFTGTFRSPVPWTT